MQRSRFVILVILIVVSVLAFGVFQYSDTLGFVHINGVNALLLVPFICLMVLVGAFLNGGKSIFQTASEPKVLLTKRELEIVDLIKSGKKNHEIAETLFVEISTIKTHINNIYTKLQIQNRDQLLKLEDDHS